MAQAGEAIPRRAGLGGTLERAGAGLRQKGVASESAEPTHARTHTHTHAAALVQSPMPAFPACPPLCPLPSDVPGREGEQSRVRRVGRTGLCDFPNPAPAPGHTRYVGKFGHSRDWTWGSGLPRLVWRRFPGSVAPRFPGWPQAHSTIPTLFVTWP